MDDIAAIHATLISSLNKLYDALVAMRYLSPEEVLRPPHSFEAISDDTFQPLGYEPETIQLMRLIPHLRGNVAWGFQNDGTEILPRSQAVSYAIERDTDWIDYLRWGDDSMSPNHKLLHPWMLRLSIGRMYPGQYGVDLIYDTRMRMIIEWSDADTKSWDQSEGRPTKAVFAEILEKFTSLEWVPCFDEASPGSRRILENPICFQNLVFGGMRLPKDPTLAMAQVRRDGNEKMVSSLREAINHWRSLQILYQKSGWDTEDYDPGRFESLRREWLGRLKHFDQQSRLARRRSASQSEEIRLAKEAFLADSAGANAV